MGLSVEDQKAAKVEMMKEKYPAIIVKAEQVLSDTINAKASVKDRCVVEKKKRPLGKENKRSARRPILAAKKPQESKGFMVKSFRKTDVPKFMTFNDIQAEARLMKRRRWQREIELQREAARIAINNVTKTVDFDNLSVMKEFEKLLACPRASYYAYGSLLM